MLRQQFKQYIHHNHYMSISDKTTHYENMPVTLQLYLHYCFHSYDVDVYACDVGEGVICCGIVVPT